MPAAIPAARTQEEAQQHIRKLHQSHAHSFLPWRHLSAAHLHSLASLRTTSTDSNELRRALTSFLRLNETWPSDRDRQDGLDNNAVRREIVVDMAIAVLGFCWSHGLSAIKTSTFFSILYSTHLRVAASAGPPCSIREAWSVFERELVRHAVERPPFAIAIFAQNELPILSGWVRDTYFRHLKLYQYTFGNKEELTLHVEHSLAEQVAADKVGVSLFMDVGKVAQPTNEHAAAAGEGTEGTSTDGAPVSITSPTPATGAAAASATTSTTTASTSTLDREVQGWCRLDTAKSYYEHSPIEALDFRAKVASRSGTGAVFRGARKETIAEDGQQQQQHSSEENEEEQDWKADEAAAAMYRDPTTDPTTSESDFLARNSLSVEEAVAGIGAAAAANAAAASSSTPLLADPTDQALFDAAVSKELGALYREFATQLRQQQSAFIHRIQELEHGTGATGTSGSATTGQGGTNTNTTTAGATDATAPTTGRGGSAESKKTKGKTK